VGVRLSFPFKLEIISRRESMTDQVDLNVASKESVALTLMIKINHTEKVFDRKHILDLYAECLKATSGYREIPKDS